MNSGCKIRIYPTKEQEEILLIYCKYAHILRNFLVAKFKEDLPKITRYGIYNYDENKLLTEFLSSDFKDEVTIPIPSRLLKGVITNYKISVERAYKKLNRKPIFHKYNPNKQSFYLPARTYNVSSTIKMPTSRGFSIKGKSKIIVDSDYVKKFNIKQIKEPRFLFQSGKWFVTGAFDIPEPEKKNSAIIGLDWGIKNFLTSSTGEIINYPKSVTREFYRINSLKSKRDKKIKNSKNWHKLNNKVKKAFLRFANLKKDFIEQTTTKIGRNNSISVEDLDNMSFKKTSKSKRRLTMINPRYRFFKTLEWKC